MKFSDSANIRPWQWSSRFSIDRASPVPLYHQLAEQLSAAIDTGTLGPGDAFENELALAERLGLSRPTVRRAIGELVTQGLLVLAAGGGNDRRQADGAPPGRADQPLRGPRPRRAATPAPRC